MKTDNSASVEYRSERGRNFYINLATQTGSASYYLMAKNDLIMLNRFLDQSKRTYAAGFTDSEVFEIFSAEQILKPYDLSQDEIQEGITDGAHDGAIDSAYLFYSNTLVSERLPKARPNAEIRLVVIQSKTSEGFSEGAIEKLMASAEDLFDLAEKEDLEKVYNEGVREIFAQFRKLYKREATNFPKLIVEYYYVSKGDEVHKNVRRKAEKLKALVTRLLPDATVEFEFVDAARLVELFRAQQPNAVVLNLADRPLENKNAFLVLVKLKDFYNFITDGKGNLHTPMFDANVRDFAGETEVNAEIKASLENPSGEDFWWLNNGVTILAQKCVPNGQLKLTIKEPQIVNGLQTSNVIHQHFSGAKAAADRRHLLVRIITPRSEESRDKIIKATNSQTPIAAASLRATEKIHRDIEDHFAAKGLFYDRRKNYYRNQKKPASKIVSIPTLAQSIMAVYLQQPDDSRARPSSLLKDDADHLRLFDSTYPLDLFYNCAEIVRTVEQFLRTRSPSVGRDEITNIKFYVSMLVAIEVCKKPKPSGENIAAIDLTTITAVVMETAYATASKAFKALGGSDKVAKGGQLRTDLLTDVQSAFAAAHKSRGKPKAAGSP